MGRRRKARELAVQVLFHLEFSRGDPSGAFDLICNNFSATESIRPFARELVMGVWEHRDDLDALIGQASEHWRLERMSRVDKCILRLATYEILHRKDIPPKVSIDEAVEIAKHYGADDSSGFINGVLDNIYNRLDQQGRVQREDQA
jgi:N utilization substance protein B